MKIFTIDDIRSWKPSYDPTIYLPEQWSGTVVDILKYPKIPLDEKLWIVCRENLIDAKTLRLFAVWCARQVDSLFPDEGSKRVIDVVEKFAQGQASREELVAARNALVNERNKACEEARDADKEMLFEVDRAAAMGTVLNAATDTVRVAALEASHDAATNVAWIAMRIAARNSTQEVTLSTAWKVAWESARYAQCAKLIELVEEAAWRYLRSMIYSTGPFPMI
jgi:hypothetical protein